MNFQHSLSIAVPPDKAWAVTIDIERWPDWTPTVERVERLDTGPFRVGSQAKVKQPQFNETIWTVTALEPGRSFAWQTRTSGVRMVATHEVVASAEGCVSHLELDITGLMARLLTPLVRRNAQKVLAKENAFLRDRCQALI